jgi:hypothetical protein
MRRPFTIASALSLLLCVATCVLWVRSYFVADCITRATWERADSVCCTRGAICIEIPQHWSPDSEYHVSKDRCPECGTAIPLVAGVTA